MTHHKKTRNFKKTSKRGIERMFNEYKNYADIVQQISAVRAALDDR